MYLPNPLHKKDATQCQFCVHCLNGLNLEFFFHMTGGHNNDKEFSLSYHLLKVVGKIVEYRNVVYKQFH